ncbi:MAG TPA: CoA transferase [Hyphomicrobiaceae bacterium]|nr:CoA transferase [Hyphomicrobiaceae bacterium]
MLPLTGVKVVEIANNVAGPYAGFILAALGADVLKVERPEGGDDARGWGPPFWRGTSATFQALNVNKRGVTLDLKQTADVVRLKAILSEADVLVHNLRPGVLGGLGLGSAALAALNERLVYCAISAFGASGPLQASVGYEPIVQAFAGLFSINGYPDRPGARMGTSVLDLGSATWAALGCIAALLQREKSGRGCVVDTSLLETALGLLTVHFARFQASGKVPERHPSGSLAVVIFEAFETADGQVIVAAANDRLFAKLASEVGHPEWIEDIRYKTNADRHANKMALLTEVRAIMRRETSAAWVARLEKAGVPCSAINDLPAIRAHPQTEALGMVQAVPEIDLGLLSLPLSLDGERPAIRARAPQLGEHNAELDAPWTGKQG